MLTAESAATFVFVYAFITSPVVDYCNVDLPGAPMVITNKLKRVIKQESRAAARKPRDAASVLFC